jgi:hypothetical protein
LNFELAIWNSHPTRLTFRTDGMGCNPDLLWSVSEVRPRQIPQRAWFILLILKSCKSWFRPIMGTQGSQCKFLWTLNSRPGTYLPRATPLGFDLVCFRCCYNHVTLPGFEIRTIFDSDISSPLNLEPQFSSC